MSFPRRVTTFLDLGEVKAGAEGQKEKLKRVSDVLLAFSYLT